MADPPREFRTWKRPAQAEPLSELRRELQRRRDEKRTWRALAHEPPKAS
jgi:hypothetical protein